MRRALAPSIEAAGTRLAASGAVLGLLGVGIRLARPSDIGWGGVAVALAWGAASVAVGVAALRRRAWAPLAGSALLGLALLALGALALKVAHGPDPSSGLAGVAVVAGVLSTALWGLAQEVVWGSILPPRLVRMRASPIRR